MSWIVVLVWGGIVGVDATSFLQVMVSRPLVAAAVAGALLGHPLEGAIIGAVLEAFSLSTLPIGAARYPEAGTAAVAATGAYAALAGAGTDTGLLLFAVVFALGWERLGGESVVLLRHLNERFAAAADVPQGVEPGWIVRRHAAALALDFARAGLVTIVGWGVAMVLLSAVRPHWGVDALPTLAVLAAAAAGMVGASLSLFGRLSERRWAFALGIACGTALLLLG